MKRNVLVFCVFLLALGAHTQVLFQEDFDGIGGPTNGGAGTYSFPSGWLLRNVDNLIPHMSVSYVNAAWERREDFNFNVTDSCAFSTSWYSPAGVAEDWMWTPPIVLQENCELKWNAVTYDPLYPDGYEVRIMVAPDVPTGGTGDIGNQITHSTVLFATAQENTTWTTHTVSLSAYDNETVYIGFRNNSNDKFLLLIDDVVVERVLDYDAEILNTDMNEYTQIPENQEATFTFEAEVRNNGGLAMTNVTLEVDVYDESDMVVYSTSSMPHASLASDGVTTLTTTGSFIGNAAGVYRVHYDITSTETDQEPTNDSLSRYITISETVYARDNENISGQLGIGSGNGGYLGQQFSITAETFLSSFSIYSMKNGGDFEMGGAVFRVVGGVPEDAPIYTAPPVLVQQQGWYEFDIPNDIQVMPGDVIMVAAQEIDSTLQVGQTTAIFTPGTEWVDWPTNPFGTWANVEDFGAQFSRAFMIRANLITVAETCNDGMLNGDEEGIDCGGSCGACPPPQAVCGVITYYVNPNSPVYDGPGTNNIWWVPANNLDAGSISSYMNPNLDVRRHLSTLTFDWTTNGACIDATPNGGSLSNADKGTAYRDCLPVRNADFNVWKMYQLRIQDPAGTAQCIGLIKVIPQVGAYGAPAIHYVIPDIDILKQELEEAVSYPDEESISDVEIAPNPGSAELFVRWNTVKNESVTIRIFDMAGNLVTQQETESQAGYNLMGFNMSSQPVGFYVVHLLSANTNHVAKWSKAN